MAFAGILAVVLVVSFSIVGPQLVAGPRVSGTEDTALVRAYYSHPVLAKLQAAVLPAAIAVLVLAAGLHAVAPRRTLATLGLALTAAIVPGYLLSASLQAALVTVAGAGGDVLPLFRLWDVYYNSALYTMEAAYVIAFTLSLAGVFPRWFQPLGLIVGALQAANVCALWIGLPDAATILGNIGMLSWLLVASLLLLGVARRQETGAGRTPETPV